VPIPGGIVPAIISLAHATGLTATAEGVENRAQAELLRALGCDTGQGRWFGAPGPAEEVAGFLAARGAPADGRVGRPSRPARGDAAVDGQDGAT
jgi:EAL domain-containing protein (putative c-di-GMP-specific phosphodiesterase class I)